MDRAMFVLAILLFNFLVASCSAKPEDPGMCALKCGGAIIGPNDPEFAIEPMNEGPKLQCKKGSSDEAGTVVVRFRVVEKINNGQDDDAKKPRRPVPSISIDPLVTGILGDKMPDGADEPRYKGITTPAEAWCSDQCGVVTLDIVPKCIPDAGAQNKVTVQVSSGALSSLPVEILVETPADATSSSTTANGK